MLRDDINQHIFFKATHMDGFVFVTGVGQGDSRL